MELFYQEKPTSLCVVLLGWANALPKHLGKYSHIYTKLGFDVIQMLGLNGPNGAPTFPKARQVLNTLKERQKQYLALKESDKSRPDWRFMTHSFSNGGLRVHVRLIRLLDSEKDFSTLKACLVGAIYDSSPATFNPHLYAHALSSHLPPGCKRSLVYWAWRVYMPFGEWLPRIFCCAGTLNVRQGFPLLISHELQRRIQHLYIYSTADDITDPKYLDDFIDKHRAVCPTSVDVLKFTDSGHVAHLRQHPEEYTQRVGQFARRLVESHKNSSSNSAP